MKAMGLERWDVVLANGEGGIVEGGFAKQFLVIKRATIGQYRTILRR